MWAKTNEPECYKQFLQNSKNQQNLNAHIESVESVTKFLLNKSPKQPSVKVENLKNYIGKDSFASGDIRKILILIDVCSSCRIKMKIVYQSSSVRNSKVSESVVIPIKVHLGYELNKWQKNSKYYYEDNKLYLHAYCGWCEDFRMYRIDRIINIVDFDMSIKRDKPKCPDFLSYDDCTRLYYYGSSF